jgi:Ras-related protein Rab-7A
MNGRMLFYEVSAKTADSIQTAFEAITRRILEKAPKDDFWIPMAAIDLEKKDQNQEIGVCRC